MRGVSGTQATAAQTIDDVRERDDGGSLTWLFQGADCCSPVSAAVFNQLYQRGRSVCYDRGETVFYEGDPVFGLYVVNSGMVKLSKRAFNGKKMIMRLLGPGDLLGAEAVFDEGVYDTEAETLAKVTLLFIDRRTLVRLVQQAPEFGARLLGQLSGELIQLRTWLLETAYADSFKRLARVLLMLAGKFGFPASVGGQTGVDLGLCLMRRELAELAGLTTETTIRILRKFQQHKWLVLKKHRVVLLDVEALKALLDAGGRLHVEKPPAHMVQ